MILQISDQILIKLNQIINSNLFAFILLQAEPPDFILFIGRFHPLIVHLPIGFLFIATAFEILARKEKFKNLGHATAVTLFLTAISSCLAVLLGYFLSLGGGYDEDLLFWHKWFGVALAIGSTLAWLFKIHHQKRISSLAGRLYVFSLMLACFFLIATGHIGGSLTHGSDYLTSYMPDPLRKLSGLPSNKKNKIKPIRNIPQAVAHTEIIQPILNERCISCHGSSKQKGELRLDDKENILKGGESGPTLVVGEPLKSRLYTYLLLPEGDDKHMPPKGKVQLTKDQIKIIGWWIDQGASFDKKVVQLKLPDSIKTALAKFGEGEKKPEGIFAKEVDEADEKKLAELSLKGIKTIKVAADVNYLKISLVADKLTFEEKDAKALEDISKQVAWLNLANKKISENAINDLDKFPNLSRLYLQKTNVEDKMLQNLSKLNNLEYLNLYGTSITNSSLKHLEPLKNLKALYIWQTKITPEEINKFKAKHPKLIINVGEN